MSEANIVELKNVEVDINGIHVLEDVSMTIKDKTFLAVIGPNGGGKSTLLKAILGLIKPDKGTITVFGKTPEEGRKMIGYLPQSKPTDLSFPISVFDVVLAGRYKRPLRNYSAQDRKAAEKALSQVEMSEYRDRQIGALSGGQIQRVFLARAIVREPRLLMLDEPTASIDPEMQRTFYSMLAGLKEKMAIVFVTHDVGAISTYVDEIACLNRRLFHHGPAEEGIDNLEEAYNCPVDLIGHGTPHRVLRNHESGGKER